MADSAVYSQLDAASSAVAAQVIAWRQHLHEHPELSNREVNTAALIAKQLRSLGLDEVRTGIAGHGVVGVLKGGLPGDRVIALAANPGQIAEIVDVELQRPRDQLTTREDSRFLDYRHRLYKHLEHH